MDNYVFVCIGTSKLIADSLGPRVGEKLEEYFKGNPRVQVFGTMKNPVHFKNANIVLKKLENTKKNIILVDSALALAAPIGNTYIGRGGIEIGKAYGKSFYFPGNVNFKTVIENQKEKVNWSIEQIELLAQKVTSRIEEVVKTCYIM